MALVSVIIPLYNVEKYLDKCIKSVVNQTLKDIEIILVNDGSDDNSSNICDEWEKKDSRIKVIHQENYGVSPARNVGVKTSTSQYIAFIDSDDYVDFNYLEKLYNVAKEDSADMVVCNFNRVTEKGKVINTDQCKISKGVFSGKEICKMLSSIPVTFISSCAKIYKRNLFENVEYPIGKVNEDEAVAHRLIYPCDKIILIDESLYFYVKHSDDKNISSNINEYNFTDAIDALYDRMMYFTKKDEELRKLAEKDYLYTIFIQIGRLKTYSKIARTKIEGCRKYFKKAYKTIQNNDSITIQHKVVLYSFKINPILTRIIAKIWFKYIFGGI